MSCSSVSRMQSILISCLARSKTGLSDVVLLTEKDSAIMGKNLERVR